MENPFISIIIPSYNSQDTIEQCLSAIYGQENNDLNFEAIVVDCSPGDEVDKIIEQRYPDTIFIKKKKCLLPGISRNIGAERARGKLLLFVDDDVVLEKGALDRIWQYYKDGYKTFSGAFEVGEYFTLTWAGFTKHLFFKHEYQKRRGIEARRYLGAGLLACDREIFLKEKGFRALPQGEDTEFTERLSKKGYELFFIPDIIAHLIHGETLYKVLTKIFNIGFYIYQVRYEKYADWKKLCFVALLPIFAFVKVMRIFIRNLIFLESSQKIKLILASPLLFVCGITWMFGVYKAFLKAAF